MGCTCGRVGRSLGCARLLCRADFVEQSSEDIWRAVCRAVRRAVLEAKVGMAPGIAFGRGSERFIRLCYAQSNERLTLAMDRLEGFVANYQES